MSDLEQNKKVVVDYFQMVVGGGIEKAIADYLGPGYVQHNPDMQFGDEGFIEFNGAFRRLCRHVLKVIHRSSRGLSCPPQRERWRDASSWFRHRAR
ncbi:nuclear transport factor 2 family protein [Streptomyces wedmorensis]|uniref:nuclear transport factor 2 family protein n=1 Tax=Streptomyces wedmorensis TaxID=43759 RepID=UPI0005243F1D|nr:hypothetical protein [Streptomyces wedmorensis]